MNKNLKTLRKQIDDIDQKLFILLSKRMRIVEKIGKLKREENISIFDKKRWEHMLKASQKASKELGLSKEFMKDILDTVHKYSLKIQK